ncbi:hypothetical protein [Flavisphingomonas formosensis]|uniref:hypothetical protein n=1 Tax=Flavisphingomonas formosensis TaxID=861534 RepID=UPI0012FA95CE|nr:hypothetical protein [Sphingomonas formosensis]
MSSKAMSSGGHIRRRHLPLLASCALAAVLAMPSVARGQAFQGAPSTASGSVGYDRSTPGIETITIGSSSAIINWTPSDSGSGGGTIDFLPKDNVANFTGRGNYTVLNRIIPEDPSRPIGLNGTINSTIGSARGGTLWFYSPGGIVVGSSATFNIGSLLLTADDIISKPGAKTVQFRGDADSRAAVSVEKGAKINALNAGSYVALIAPRISQAGTVTVNGTANYVAAEAADITITQNLFDIQVTTGSYVDPKIAGDEVTLSHTGTTTGPASTGSGDPHLVMMVAVPKNDAVTMLVGGNVGFEAASNASIENGVVVLSSGSNIRTFFDNYGDFQLGIDFNLGVGQNADLKLTDGTFSSRVLAAATNDVSVAGNLNFSKNLVINAGQDIHFEADAGKLIQVGGDLVLQSFGFDANAYPVPATVTLAAKGGTVKVGGDATLIVSGLDAQLGNVTAGTAKIEGNGGTITIGGDLALKADALPGHDEAVAGTASIAMTGGSLTIGGALALSAEADGNVASGGRISVLADGAKIAVTKGITASTKATGNSGFQTQTIGGGGWGDAEGGSISIVTTGTPVASISATDATLIASAVGADGIGGTDGGNATGGTIVLGAGAGSLTLGNVTADASATGGRGSDAWSGSGYHGGAGRGGTIDIYANAGTLTVGDVSFDVSGFGGDGGNAFETGYGTPHGGDGGFGTGGNASFRAVSGGAASANTLSITANGAGGAGGSGSFQGKDGSAGNGGGGSIEVSTTGGIVTIRGTSVDLFATGTSGNGVMMAGEGGSEGRGGVILVSAIDGTIGAPSGSSGFALNADASGFGGYSTAAGGTGANGTGGRITVEADQGEAGVPGRITSRSMTLTADGRGGDSAQSFASPLGGGGSGDGGVGSGGTITLDAASGELRSGDVGLSARGRGGTSNSGGTGGLGQGGTVGLSSGSSSSHSGTIALGDVSIDARGFGGGPGEMSIGNADGGEGRGGNVNLSVTAGSLKASRFDADAGGIGGDGLPGNPDSPFGSGGGNGGDGRGGTIMATIATSASSSNSIDLGSAANLHASGQGGAGGSGAGNGMGGHGGSGFGGSIGFSDADPLLLALTADGVGGAGGNGATGGMGGSGSGGAISLSSFGGTLLADSALLSAKGLGGAGGMGLSGDGGTGGAGTGGLIDLYASGGGMLTIKALSASAAGIGGAGGDSADGGNGGSGGDAAGGAIGFTADGGATAAIANATAIDASATGGAGGVGSSGVTGGTGGQGGQANGGGITLLASGQGTLSILDDPHSALIFDVRATGGAGGRGGDASGIGSAAGDGGAGGAGNGGFASVSASGGSIRLGSASLLADGAGGQGAAGGSGTGGPSPQPNQPPIAPVNGAAGANGPGAGGRVVIAVADDNELGLSGSAQLGTIVIGASGDQAGFVEITDRAAGPTGSLRIANLTASANGAASATTPNISVYSESGAIEIQGSAALTTGGSAQFDFADTGGLDVGGDLFVTTGQRIDINHAGQAATPADSIHAGSANFEAGTAFSATPGSVVRTDEDLSIIALNGPVDAATVRAGGKMTVQASQDVTIGQAHAGGDIGLTSLAGSVLVSDIASDGLVDAIGNAVTLTAPGALAIRSATSRIGDVAITAVNDLSVLAADAAQDLLLSGAGITGSTIGATRDVKIDAVGNVGFASVSAKRDLAVTAGGDAAITEADAARDIAIDAKGLVSASSLTAGGKIDIKAGKATLGAAATTGSGAIEVTSVGDIQFIAVHSGGGVTFTSAQGGITGGSIDAKGAMALDADAGIDTHSLSAGGKIDLSAGHGAILVRDDIASGGVVNATGTAVTLTATGKLAIDNVAATGGDVRINAAGDLSVDKATASQSVTLGSSGGTLDVQNATAGGTGSLTLTAAGDIGFGELTAPGAVTVQSIGGSVTGDAIDPTTVSVSAAGTIVITTVHSDGDIQLSSSGGAIQIADIAAGGLVDASGTAVTLTALGGLSIDNVQSSKGDIHVNAGGPLSVNSANAAGALSLDVGTGGLSAQSLQAGKGATIDAAAGIDIDTLHAGSDIDLTSSGGAVLVRSDIASGSHVDARGTAVTLNAIGDLHVGSVTSTSGDIALLAATLSVDQARSAGGATFFASDAVTIGDARAATDIDIQSGGTAGLTGDVEAGSALGLAAQGLVTIEGKAIGETIAIASSDIRIGNAAVIGGGTETSQITLRNSAPGTTTTIGGSGGSQGYVLDNGEFSRLHAQNITIRVDAPGALVPSAPDIRIEDLDVIGADGANANIASATGALTILSPGGLRVAGDVRFTDAASGNILSLNAGGLLDVITPDGSVTITGKDDTLSGRLQLGANSIFVGTLKAEQDLATLTDTEARNGRLGENDGLDNSAGYIQAGALEFTPGESLYIQNSGQNGTTPGTRGGFTARSVAIVTPANGTQTDIVLNGRILNSDGSFTTGKAIIPLIKIQQADSDKPGSYTLGSKANNCLIAGGDCVEGGGGPPTPPVQDIVSVIDGDTPIGVLTPFLDQTAIQLIDFDPYTVMPDIDDPVTGAGNDDLWSAICPGTAAGSPCKLQ